MIPFNQEPRLSRYQGKLTLYHKFKYTAFRYNIKTSAWLLGWLGSANRAVTGTRGKSEKGWALKA